MKTINFSQTRQNVASTFDTVVDNVMPIIVTRQNKEPVVIISVKIIDLWQRLLILCKVRQMQKG